MTPSESFILGALKASPRGLSEREIGDLLYADDVNGGPLSPTIKVFVCRLRKAIAAEGHKIVMQFGSHRYCLLRTGEDLKPTSPEEVLPWRCLEIFNLVKRKPGIGTKEISDRLHIKYNQPGVLVTHINDKLKKLGIKVVGKPHNGYRVEAAA